MLFILQPFKISVVNVGIIICPTSCVVNPAETNVVTFNKGSIFYSDLMDGIHTFNVVIHYTFKQQLVVSSNQTNQNGLTYFTYGVKVDLDKAP